MTLPRKQGMEFMAHSSGHAMHQVLLRRQYYSFSRFTLKKYYVL